MVRSLFIATPCYGGNVNVFFMESVIKLIFECQKHDIKCSFFKIPFESLIPRARNVCASSFIKSRYSHMIFIDSDIQFNASDVIKLIEADVDVIGGSYPTKSINMQKLQSNCTDVMNLSYKEIISKSVMYTSKLFKENVTPQNQSKIECEFLATGFMMIKRNVFIRMIEEFKHIRYINDIPAYREHTINDELYDFFHCKIIDNKYVSEDYGFCSLWKLMGGKVYTDLTIKLNHIGSMTFYGEPLKNI